MNGHMCIQLSVLKTKCCMHLNDKSRTIGLLVVYFLLHTSFHFLSFSSKDINFIIRKYSKAISILLRKKKAVFL